jgi:hypothetical protein
MAIISAGTEAMIRGWFSENSTPGQVMAQAEQERNEQTWAEYERETVSAWVAKPPPVLRQHNASDIHGGMPERLSNPRIHAFVAEIIRSRGSLGSARNGAEFGSTSARSISCVVDFAEPCSPQTFKMGNGPFGFSAARSHATINTKSASSQFKNGRSSWMLPPASGTGSEIVPLDRMKYAGGGPARGTSPKA